MRVSYVPVLRTLGELYSQPRDMRRFQRYIATLTGGTDDVVLPIGVANPMAREHALDKIDELLALGAEDIGAEAAATANSRLAKNPLDVEIEASIVLVDDLAGGWTNRFTTEAMVRFPGRGALRRPFATALAWTSESPTAQQLGQEVLAAIYRAAWRHRHGLPTSLRAMLEQEGLAGAFAGQRPSLTADKLAEARTILNELGNDPPYPQAFAALYGDEAAEQLGYAPLGLPARAGFEVALADALERRLDPLTAVLG